MTEHEGQSEVITLVDDDGNEHDFFMVDSFQVNSRQYAVLVPVIYDEEDEEPEEESGLGEDAYIFRIDSVDGEDILVEVEEEEEWIAAAQEYETRRKEVEQEEDGELS